MCELTPDQQRQLDELLARDSGLASGVRPLLDGEFGLEARALFLHHLSQRLATGGSTRAALVLALGDAMRSVRGERDDV